MPNIREAVTFGARRLEDSGADSPWLDSQILLAKAIDKNKEHLFAHPFSLPSEGQWELFMEFLSRRSEGVPLAYILGHSEFYSLPFKVDSRTLIPRPATESLVEQVLGMFPEDGKLNVLDIGTGSGAIAVALAVNRPSCKVVATDISQGALQVAGENLLLNGVPDRVELVHCDLYPDGEKYFDLIVSNPPYVAGPKDAHPNVARYEPGTALYSADGGLEVTRRIISGAAERLAPDGAIVLETGYNTSPAVMDMLEKSGYFQDVGIKEDLDGWERVVFARGPEWTG